MTSFAISIQNFKKDTTQIANKLVVQGNNVLQVKGYYIAFEGTLYNRMEIVKEYFNSSSEYVKEHNLIIKLYEKYKEHPYKLCQELYGQYAFVIISDTHIFVARDAIGVVPLYIGITQIENNKRIMFSTKLQMLTQSEDTNKQNPKSLVENIRIFYPRKYLHAPLLPFNVHQWMDDPSYYLNFYEYKHKQNENNAHNEMAKIVTRYLQTYQGEDLHIVMSRDPISLYLLLILVEIYPVISKTGKSIKTYAFSCDPMYDIADALETEHFVIEYKYTCPDIDLIKVIETYEKKNVRRALQLQEILSNCAGVLITFAELSSIGPRHFVNFLSDAHINKCVEFKLCRQYNIKICILDLDLDLIKLIMHFGYEKFLEAVHKWVPNLLMTGDDTLTKNAEEAYKLIYDEEYSDEEYMIKRMYYTLNRPCDKEELYYRHLFCSAFNDTSYKNTSEFTVKLRRS